MTRSPAALMAEAQARHQAGRLAEAARLYEQVLAARPEEPTALALLGALRLQQGDAQAAAKLLRRAATRRPDDPAPRYNLGIALIRLGRHAEAAEALAEVARRNPDHADAWKSLGDARKALKDMEGAAAAWRRALALRPDHPGALLNLGAFLTSISDGAGGEDCARRLLALRPQDAAAWNNLGLALIHQERRAEARHAFRQALAHNPAHHRAAENLGDTLRLERRIAEAEAAYAQAAAIHEADGRTPSADALAGLLHTRAMLCRWDGLPPVLARLAKRLDDGPEPFALLAHDAFTPAQVKRAAIAHARRAGEGIAPLPPRRATPAGRIRLGYISPDFNEHPVGQLAVEALTLHDRDAFAVHGYALTAGDGGPTRARLEAGIETFRDVHALDDATLAARIAEDGIDILIDLAGWTTGQRPGVMARRPAPVAAAWLGYPGTSGAPWMDYAIQDAVTAPPGSEGEFTEALIRLPFCLPHDRTRPEAARPSRAACSLPEDAVVLGCFAQSWKIGRAVFEAWLRILAAVPGTVLWLRAAPAEVAAMLQAAATRAGIPPERILFASSLPSAADHLARIALADLILDTWPYGSHASAMEALWAGVPLIALPAPGVPGRVAASALRTAGLDSLVAGTVEEFIAMATHLAQDPASRAALRGCVAECRSSPLFDTPRLVRALEAAYRAIQARAAAGLPPAAITPDC